MLHKLQLSTLRMVVQTIFRYNSMAYIRKKPINFINLGLLIGCHDFPSFMQFSNFYFKALNRKAN